MLRKERAGEYLGQCEQVIPHITNEIKSRLRAQDVDDVDVVNCVVANSIDDVPKVLFDAGLDAYVVRELGLPFHDVDWD